MHLSEFAHLLKREIRHLRDQLKRHLLTQHIENHGAPLLIASFRTSLFTSIFKLRRFEKILIPLKIHHIDNLPLVLFQKISHDVAVDTRLHRRADGLRQLHTRRNICLDVMDKVAIVMQRTAFHKQCLLCTIDDVVYRYQQF